jgi:hypothetical protein
MESNWSPFGWELVIACTILLFFGIFYNFLVTRFQKRTTRYTAEMVAGGVLVTVITSGPFIGWVNMIVVLIMFTCTGLPMIIGFMSRVADDDEHAKQAAKDMLK